MALVFCADGFHSLLLCQGRKAEQSIKKELDKQTCGYQRRLEVITKSTEHLETSMKRAFSLGISAIISWLIADFVGLRSSMTHMEEPDRRGRNWVASQGDYCIGAQDEGRQADAVETNQRGHTRAGRISVFRRTPDCMIEPWAFSQRSRDEFQEVAEVPRGILSRISYRLFHLFGESICFVWKFRFFRIDSCIFHSKLKKAAPNERPCLLCLIRSTYFLYPTFHTDCTTSDRFDCIAFLAE